LKKFQILSAVYAVALMLWTGALVAETSAITEPVSASASSLCADILGAKTISMHAALYAPSAPAVLKRLGELYAQRSPQKQMAIDAELTRLHAEREMYFAKKNPLTGLYDQAFAVQVNGQLIPFMATDQERMVQSTRALAVAKRKLLQQVFSTPELTAESLGFDKKMPREVADLAVKIIRENIYFERALVAPQMKDYPFGGLIGYDFAIVDPLHPKPQLFETNDGTPSGGSNTGQIVNDLANVDPEAWAIIKDYMVPDNSFTTIRADLESNGRAWTGKQELSTMTGPGIYNGAHPDVAAQAKSMEVPLIKSSDLYTDRNGDVHLLTTDGSNPVVNTVISRMEEAFLMQSNREGIPMIVPDDGIDRKALGKKLGLKLRAGAVYQWIRAADEEVIDIRRDENGQPLYQEVWDTMSPDPNDPSRPAGTFLRAVLNKKLYISNLGGRVVDDKRLLRIISDYLLEDDGDDNHVARPIRGLTQAELPRFFEHPEAFVVKVPNESGGKGIAFMSQVSSQRKAEIVVDVRKNPTHYEIQYVAHLTTVPVATADGMHGERSVIDLRQNNSMNAVGDVHGGPQLVRVALPNSLLPNNSQGGGYGTPVILSDKPLTKPYQPKVEKPWRGPIAESQEKVVQDVLTKAGRLFNELDGGLAKDNIFFDYLRVDCGLLVYQMRDLLFYLSPQAKALISRLREFSQATENDYDQAHNLRTQLRYFLLAVHSGEEFEGNFRKQGAEFFSENPRLYSDYLSNPTASVEQLLAQFKDEFELRVLPEPEITVTRRREHTRFEKVEIAEYVRAKSPKFQAIIDRVKAAGGQLRLMRSRIVDRRTDKFDQWRFEEAYFETRVGVDAPSRLIPIIAIDLTQDRRMSGNLHELTHFAAWVEIYQKRRLQGMSNEAAAKATNRDVIEIENLVAGEDAAVMAEIEVERKFPNDPDNRTIFPPKPTEFFEQGYVNRVTYPQEEGVRDMIIGLASAPIHRTEDSLLPGTAIRYIRRYMGEMIDKARTIKAQALDHWHSHAADDPGGNHLSHFQNATIYDLLTKPYAPRFAFEDYKVTFDYYFQEVCHERNLSPAECGQP
jgi:uncharacterized circularly permuted ATP-grasp superfamily protein